MADKVSLSQTKDYVPYCRGDAVINVSGETKKVLAGVKTKLLYNQAVSTIEIVERDGDSTYDDYSGISTE